MLTLCIHPEDHALDFYSCCGPRINGELVVLIVAKITLPSDDTSLR
jgi:hypothetical protein